MAEIQQSDMCARGSTAHPAGCFFDVSTKAVQTAAKAKFFILKCILLLQDAAAVKASNKLPTSQGSLLCVCVILWVMAHKFHLCKMRKGWSRYGLILMVNQFCVLLILL